MNLIAVALVIGLIGAFLTWFVAKSRNLPGIAGYVIIGFLFPIIGLLIAALVKRREPPRAPGWYPDPWHESVYRWHDGQAWTHQQSNGEPASA